MKRGWDGLVSKWMTVQVEQQFEVELVQRKDGSSKEEDTILLFVKHGHIADGRWCC